MSAKADREVGGGGEMLTWRVPLHSFRKEYNLLELTTTHWELSGARLNSLELNRPHRNSVELTRIHKNSLRTHRNSLRPRLNSSELIRSHKNSLRTQWDATWTHEKSMKQESIENSFKLISNSLELSRNHWEFSQNPKSHKIQDTTSRGSKIKDTGGDGEIFTPQRPHKDSTHAQTKRNDFPVGWAKLPPPTSQ